MQEINQIKRLVLVPRESIDVFMEKSMKQPDNRQKRQKVYIGHYSITGNKTIHWLNNLNGQNRVV